VFGEVGLVSGLVRAGLIGVGTRSAMLALCPDFIGKVGLVSLRVRRGRLNVRNCSTRTVNVGISSDRST